MIILYIILGVLALIILLLILIVILPFTIYIDTINRRYEFFLSVFFRAKYIQDDKAYLKMYIFFFPLKFDLSKARKISFSLKSDKSEKVKRSGFSYKMINPVWYFIVKIIRSFRIKKFNIGFDTGDFPLNAQLLPLLFHLSGEKVHLAVNFVNENYAVVELKNNMFSFIRYGLPLYFKIRKIRKRRK